MECCTPSATYRALSCKKQLNHEDHEVHEEKQKYSGKQSAHHRVGCHLIKQLVLFVFFVTFVVNRRLPGYAK